MSTEQLNAIKRHLESALGTVGVMLSQAEQPQEPPAEEPPVEEPTEPEQPTEPEEPTEPEQPPAPPPATPNPPASNDDLVDGLATGATPCGASGGIDVVNCTDPGVIVTPSEVRITQPLRKFTGWDIGTRRLIFQSVADVVAIYSRGGQSGKNPLIHCQPGGGFGLMEYSSIIDQSGSMVLKQEPGGIAGEITRCVLTGMAQDAIKVGGDNLIHENLIADPLFGGGSPHADVLTVMSAEGDVVFRLNNVDWNYANLTDQSGINNWFRIENYPAYSGRYDNVIIDGNALRHSNARSFAMQVVKRNSPVYDGSIQVRINRMNKAGGNRKILYAPSNEISVWAGNTDFAGNEIDYSAT